MINKILLLAIFQISNMAYGSAPSGKEWFTLTTENFRLHHTAPLEKYSRDLAASFERVLPIMEKNLQWKAPVPIDVVVMDPSDSANGLAVSFPNTHMEVFAVPFESDTSLAQYYNWVDELAIHELTHIVANDSSLGFYSVLRKIFGSWVKPNGLQAQWLTEGLAVYQETAHSRGGRGRSVLLEAILRAAANENTTHNPDYIAVDRFNDGVPWWPGGNTAYLLGYTIQAVAEGSSGGKFPHLPGAVSIANADRFPFMPDSNLRSLLEKDWSLVWEEAQPLFASRYVVPKEDLVKPCTLTNSGKFTGGHALSKDGWIYYSDEDKEYGYWLSRVMASAKCGSDQVERLYRKRFPGPTAVSLSPSGHLLAFTVSDIYNGSDFLNDLYLLNTTTLKTTQLTHSQRASDPAFIDENTLAFVTNEGNTKQAIRILDMKSKKSRIVFVADFFERISGLSASNKYLYFSLHNNKGAELLQQLSLEGGVPFLVTDLPRNASTFAEKNAFPLPDGAVLFAASYGGSTQDIFHYNPQTRKRTMVARSSSGFLDRPILSIDEKFMYATNLDTNGQNIIRIPFDLKNPWIALVKETDSDLHQYLTKKNSTPSIPNSADSFSQMAESAKVEPYSVLDTTATSMLPQYWIPEISSTTEGSLWGASTSGNDALDYRKYGLMGQYDSRAKFPHFHFFYLDRSQKLNLLLDARQYNSYFSGSNTSNRVSIYTLQGMFPLGDLGMAFGGSYRDLEFFGTTRTQTLGFLKAVYEDVGQTPMAMRPNFGKYFSLYSAYFPTSSRENSFFDFNPLLAFYTGGFAPSHGVEMKAAGGISTNDRLGSNYYLGGGPNQASPTDFVVRGYPTDTLLGQKITTANVTYSFPLAHPYHGWNTNPLFIKSIGFDFHLDAGSANFISLYNGSNFLGYRKQELANEVIFGTGVDFVTQGTIFYHVPLTVDLGIHYGDQKKFGGGWVLFLGIDIGLERGALKPQTSH